MDVARSPPLFVSPDMNVDHIICSRRNKPRFYTLSVLRILQAIYLPFHISVPSQAACSRSKNMVRQFRCRRQSLGSSSSDNWRKILKRRYRKAGLERQQANRISDDPLSPMIRSSVAKEVSAAVLVHTTFSPRVCHYSGSANTASRLRTAYNLPRNSHMAPPYHLTRCCRIDGV